MSLDLAPPASPSVPDWVQRLADAGATVERARAQRDVAECAQYLAEFRACWTAVFGAPPPNEARVLYTREQYPVVTLPLSFETATALQLDGDASAVDFTLVRYEAATGPAWALAIRGWCPRCQETAPSAELLTLAQVWEAIQHWQPGRDTHHCSAAALQRTDAERFVAHLRRVTRSHGHPS